MITSHGVVRTICRISSYLHLSPLTHLANKACFLLVRSFLDWIHQMRFLTLIYSVVCSSAFILTGRRIYRISCFLRLGRHYVPLLHLLLETRKLSINLLVLQVKGVATIRKNVCLLEFSFILFNLHVHLGESLLKKLLFPYLFNSIWTRIP